MINKFEKNFYPTITDIKYIGDELKFQREYYNSLNKEQFVIDDRKIEIDYINIGERLGEYLVKNFQYSRNEVSSDVIENIENNNYVKYGKIKGSHTPFNPSIHYFFIYSLFKIYDFLDDYEILMLLKKYEVISDLEEKKLNEEPLTKKEQELWDKIKRFKDDCRINIIENNYYNPIHMKSPVLLLEWDYINQFIEVYKEEGYELYGIGHRDINLNKGRIQPYCLGLSKLIRYARETYKKLDSIGRKTKSLDLHKPTHFLDVFIDEKVEFISLRTLIYMLEDLKLTKTDIYFFTKKKIEKPITPYQENFYEKYYNSIL